MPQMRGRRRHSTALSFDDVRAFALTLPNVEASTMYGSPAVKMNGHWLACMTSHKSAEPNTLAVRVDFGDRDEMIATDPDTYYLKDHYVAYPTVLVRLSRVHPDALHDLLQGAWRLVSEKRPTKKRARRQPVRRGRAKR